MTGGSVHVEYLIHLNVVNGIMTKGIKKFQLFPENMYMLKVNNKNTRRRCEICLNVTVKILEHRSDVEMLT